MQHKGETDGRETVFDAGPMVWRFVDTWEPVPLRSDEEAPAADGRGRGARGRQAGIAIRTR